jgi:hypothetical protein
LDSDFQIVRVAQVWVFARPLAGFWRGGKFIFTTLLEPGNGKIGFSL